jgi:hypothetical protein
MFIVGMIVGIIIGAFATLIIYSCIIAGKKDDEIFYKEK